MKKQGGKAMTDKLALHSAYFEDLEVGQEMRTTARTVTEADVVMFAGLSGDYHALHTDAVYASQGPFGQRIAHGLLGLAIASGLAMQQGMLQDSVLAFRELTCKFRKPIFIGDTVHAEIVVSKLKPMSRIGGGLVELEIKLYNQRQELVLSGTWGVLVRSREVAPAGSGGPAKANT
jgi:3-hydroxybutyryl-CoA dehydratase